MNIMKSLLSGVSLISALWAMPTLAQDPHITMFEAPNTASPCAFIRVDTDPSALFAFYVTTMEGGYTVHPEGDKNFIVALDAFRNHLTLGFSLTSGLACGVPEITGFWLTNQ